MKRIRIGPNTEPWGTPVTSRVGDDLQPEHETVKVLFDRYEENQERTLLRRPNRKDQRCSRMEWSIVSKAAERSRRVRQVTSCLSMALMRSSCKSSFSSMVFCVSRQKRVKHRVCSEVMCDAIFHYTFSKFR